MRIDAFNKVSQLYQANSTKKIASANAVNKNDRVEISRMGKDFQIAKQAVANAPDIREDKVAALKQKLASGNYNVSAEELADKMVESCFNESV